MNRTALGIKWSLPLLLVMALSVNLVACSRQETSALPAIEQVVHEGDECHLCGMIILHFPGPKALATTGTDSYVRKFCSSLDMFSFYLDPENTRQVNRLLVHDMTGNDWQKPDDKHFIDATIAWYVIGSDKRGAMGHTLASFATRQGAEAFAAEHKGTVLPFAQITLDTLNQIIQMPQ